MNIRITHVLRGITAIEAGVLVVSGGGLFFFPETFGELWPWDLLPFNIRFIGAIYLAAMVSALALVIHPYWSTGRVVVPMIAIFTVLVLVISVVYAEQFTGPTMPTILWYLLYLVIPVNALYHLWLYRGHVSSGSIHLPTSVTYWLLIESVILGGYGIALLIAPQFASGFWPWALDSFHAQLYSVAFITPALGAYLLTRAATGRELVILGITEGVLGLLAIVGLLIVDRVMWSDVDSWAWIVLCIYVLLSGMIVLLLPIFRNEQIVEAESQSGVS